MPYGAASYPTTCRLCYYPWMENKTTLLVVVRERVVGKKIIFFIIFFFFSGLLSYAIQLNCEKNCDSFSLDVFSLHFSPLFCIIYCNFFSLSNGIFFYSSVFHTKALKLNKNEDKVLIIKTLSLSQFSLSFSLYIYFWHINHSLIFHYVN